MKISKYNFEWKKSKLVMIPTWGKSLNYKGNIQKWFCWLWFIIVIKDI